MSKKIKNSIKLEAGGGATANPDAYEPMHLICRGKTTAPVTRICDRLVGHPVHVDGTGKAAVLCPGKDLYGRDRVVVTRDWTYEGEALEQLNGSAAASVLLITAAPTDGQLSERLWISADRIAVTAASGSPNTSTTPRGASGMAASNVPSAPELERDSSIAAATDDGLLTLEPA